MYVPEEKTVTLGKNNYLLRALPADYGLEVLNRLQATDSTPSAAFVKELVYKSVTVNNMQPTDEWFNKNFSRNYKELYDLFQSIVEFNFGDMTDPNGGSGTSE